MARPIAALHTPHASRAQWAPGPEALTGKQISELRDALGRDLTGDQIAGIEQAIHRIKVLQRASNARAEQREVKKHLNALGKAADSDLVQMFAFADATTRAYMFDQLYAINQLINPTPEAIRQAAKTALAAMPKQESGSNKSWQIFAARWAIQHWRDYGGSDCLAWASTRSDLDRGRKTKQYQTPIVEWASVFFPPELPPAGEKQRPRLGARRIADLITHELTPKEFAKQE